MFQDIVTAAAWSGTAANVGLESHPSLSDMSIMEQDGKEQRNRYHKEMENRKNEGREEVKGSVYFEPIPKQNNILGVG